MDTAVGMNIGAPCYGYREAQPDERKWQVITKFGVDEVHNYDYQNYHASGVRGYFSTGVLSDWNGSSGSSMIPMSGPSTM